MQLENLQQINQITIFVLNHCQFSILKTFRLLSVLFLAIRALIVLSPLDWQIAFFLHSSCIGEDNSAWYQLFHSPSYLSFCIPGDMKDSSIYTEIALFSDFLQLHYTLLAGESVIVYGVFHFYATTFPPQIPCTARI